jgi:hypothetical protein
MAAATVILGETNGAGKTYYNHTGSGLSKLDMGGLDSYEIDPVANPIIAGQNSFEKYIQFEVTNMGTSSAIKNFRVWMSTGTVTAPDYLYTNLQTVQGTYDTHKKVDDTGYTQPVGGTTASTIATRAIPTTNEGVNLGIGGSLTGSLAAVGKSDYLVMQLHIDGGTTAGQTLQLSFQYDEVA